MRDYFNPDWTEYIFGLLFSATWQAAALVVLAVVGSLCVRRAAVRCAIWTVCVIGLAIVPVVSPFFPHVFLAYAGTTAPLHFPSMIARPPHTDAVGADSFWTFTDGSWSDGACQAVVYIWLAGALFAAIRLTVGWITMVELLRQAQRCKEPRVRELVERLVCPGEKVAVLKMRGLVAAACWQIHRPKIILPAHTRALSDAEMEMMIRHELAHIRRSDPTMLFLQRLVEIVYWFHPAVWWVTLQTSKYREFVCDDLVVRAGYTPHDYAQCLGQFAMLYYAPLPMAPAGLGMVWSQHLVLQRVKRLLHGAYAEKDLPRTHHAILSLAGLVGILLVSVARVDWTLTSIDGPSQWTPWPPRTASMLDTVGIKVRDFPLDAHRYDPRDAWKQPHSSGR